MKPHPSLCIQRQFLRALIIATAGLLDHQAPAQTAATSIPFSEIGAKATADYKGDAISVTATAEGALLRCGFQKLEGHATREGLWLTSSEDGSSFCVRAAEIGRVGAAFTKLAPRGIVSVADKVVSYARPQVVEQYSVSMDGVRQDFLIAQRPAGTGRLRVGLAVAGARVDEAAYGAKLTLHGSGRELAYSRLRVTDATGRELQAVMEVTSADALAVCVDDTAAVYPVRIDPTFSDADWVSMNGGSTGANNYIFATVLDGSGNLFIGGQFTMIGSVAASGVAKWNGSAWSALGAGMNGGAGQTDVRALLVNGTDLYAGGAFTTAGGVTVNRIAKWDGSAWSALGTGLDNQVRALAVNSANQLFVGGDFSLAGSTVSPYLVRGNLPTPDMLVEQPVTVAVSDGGARSFGTIFGGNTSLVFTIKNPGTDDLTGLTITKDGTNAADFSVTVNPVAPVAPSGSTTFTVQFAPSTSGTKSAAIHIASNANVVGKNPYDINLTGQAYFFTLDADGDTLNDATEFQMSALGFDWQVGQAALVGTLFNNIGGAQSNLNVAGYFTTAQVQALHTPAPLIQRHPTTGVFTLTIGVEKSTNLSTFTPFPMSAPQCVINGTGKLEFQFSVPDNAAFFQLRAQ